MADVIIYFVLFSFCGWVCESVFCSCLEKKPVNRGFLSGPFCPVYGFGGLIIVYILGPLRDRYVALFICGMLACTALEYVTSWVLETLFHAKWWDYTENRFNINGRVCLKFSLLFGALSVVAAELLYPPFTSLVAAVPPTPRKWLAAGMVVLFGADCAYTVHSLVQLNGKLAELKSAMEELRAKLENIQGQRERVGLAQRIEEYRADHSGRYEHARQSIQQSLGRLEGMTRARQHFQHRRIMRAFPNIRSTRYQEQLARLKESIEEWKRENRKGKHQNGDT